MKPVLSVEDGVVSSKDRLLNKVSDPVVKEQIEKVYGFLKTPNGEPGDVMKMLSLFNNSLSTLAKLPIFAEPASKALLVEFARKAYEALGNSLDASYKQGHQLKMDKLNRGKERFEAIVETTNPPKKAKNS